MIRDFSQEAKYTLYENIDSINPASSYEGIWDYLSDAKGSTKEWIWKLSIAGLLDGVDSYHKLVSERQEVNKAEIDKIFTDVQRVDAKYAGYFSEINEALKSKVDFINRMAETIAIKDQVEFAAATSSLSTALLDTKEDEVTILIKAYKQGLITEFSGEQRAKLEKFDTLLDSGNEPIKEFDRYNIMYIAYTADEPFRELFLGTLGTYTLGNVTLTDGSFYTSTGNTEEYPFAKKNTVNLNPDKTLYYDAKGPYNTFFHECGHAIDYQLGNGNYYSRQYMYGTNFDVISGDVYGKIEDNIKEYCDENLDDYAVKQRKVIQQKIINCIKNDGDISLLAEGVEREAYNDIKGIIKAELSNTGNYVAQTVSGDGVPALVRAGISDIYGGITNNVIIGNRGHMDIDEKTRKFTYWYTRELPCEPTGNQESRIYLRNTMERYDEMATNMADSM